jgi:hypothetical protein
VKQEGNGLSDERLNELLKTAAPDVEPSAALLRAVAEIPLRHPHRGSVEAWWPFDGLRRWIAVAAAALVMGVVIGAALPDGLRKSAPGEFDSEDDTGWDALSTVAMGADVSEELGP